MENYLGWAAVILFVLGGCFRAPRTSIAVYTLGNFLYILKYMQMGLYAPVIGMSCTAFCNIAFLKVRDEHLIYCLFAALIISSTIIMFNFQSELDILILVAGWAVMYGNYYRDNYVRFKVATIFSQMLWLVYTVHYDDYPMMCIAIFISFTNSYTLLLNLYRDRRLNFLKLLPY